MCLITIPKYQDAQQQADELLELMSGNRVVADNKDEIFTVWLLALYSWCFKSGATCDAAVVAQWAQVKDQICEKVQRYKLEKSADQEYFLATVYRFSVKIGSPLSVQYSYTKFGEIVGEEVTENQIRGNMFLREAQKQLAGSLKRVAPHYIKAVSI